MRIEYDENGRLMMYFDNKHEYDIMNKVRKEEFGHKLIHGHEHSYVLAYYYETKMISIIEKMRDDKIERILQIRNEDKLIRLVARVMLELWR